MRASYNTETHVFMKGAASQITNRIAPCKCGCEGSDPWHSRHFFRVIKDVRILDDFETRYIKAYKNTELVLATGRAKFPFGECEVAYVVLVAESCCTQMGWYVVEEAP